jgi:DNA-binding GntR family transcriptional regulator
MNDNISQYLDKGKNLKQISTISEAIYADLKESILKRKLKPTQRIKIGELADFLGVSQTPVREAIQRLAAENFLIIIARSEVKVVDVGVEEGMMIAELIQILEVGCIHKAIKNITDKRIKELQQLNNKLGEYFNSKQIELYIEQNDKIHRKIWKQYKNEPINLMLNQALERLRIVETSYSQYLNDNNFLTSSWESHCKLLEAIEQRDSTKAEKVLRTHWIYL